MKFLLVAIVLGVAIYLLVRVIQRRGIAPRRPPGSAGPRQVRRPVAPDDDSDFLRDLDRKKKRRRQDDPDT